MSGKSSEPTTAERAVQRFEDADAELKAFMDENEEFIDELRRLIEERNACVKEALSAVKSDLKASDREKLVIGRFGALKKRSEYWDGKELAGLLPAKVTSYFLKEIVSYEVNVTKLEQMIRQGDVDRDEAYKAFHQNAPTLSAMPGCPKEMTI